MQKAFAPVVSSLAILATLLTPFYLTAQDAQAKMTTTASASKSLDTIYLVGPDVTAPTLKSSPKFTGEEEQCKGKQDAIVNLELLIDTDGKARRVYTNDTPTVEFSGLAVKIVKQDQFIPAMRNGEPVVSAIQLKFQFELCPTPNEKGKIPSTPSAYRIAKAPAQVITPLASISNRLKIDFEDSRDGIKPPALIYQEPAEFSEYAHRAKKQGIVLVQFIVDKQGIPVEPRVIRPFGYGLDEQALKAVKKYRFKPAHKDNGEAVPVLLNVEVNFRLTD